MIEPDLDAIRRRVADLPVSAPALENRRALMGVIRDHVARYLALYFASDGAIAADPAFTRWLDELDTTVPQGVAVYAETMWAAIKGRAAVKVEWDTSTAETRSSAAIVAEYQYVTSQSIDSHGALVGARFAFYGGP